VVSGDAAGAPDVRLAQKAPITIAPMNAKATQATAMLSFWVCTIVRISARWTVNESSEVTGLGQRKSSLHRTLICVDR
jgi:hypothetical protein